LEFGYLSQDEIASVVLHDVEVFRIEGDGDLSAGGGQGVARGDQGREFAALAR
jgi:hypothetical protein